MTPQGRRGNHRHRGRSQRPGRPLVPVSPPRPSLPDPRPRRRTRTQPVGTRTSRRSLLADLANLRAHNERLRHHNTKLSERLSEILGEQVFHEAGLTRTDEIGTLRERVAELEQQLLDRRQDLQDRDDELAAARATNRDLMTRLNSRAPINEQACPTRVVHTT